jgi:pimeloyl-ACP methyl ester carboxylesterase
VSRTHRSIRNDHRHTQTLVLAGGQDIAAPPRLGRIVAELIPGARFEVLPDEAHQPFQEIPDAFNSRVDAFWAEVDARA